MTIQHPGLDAETLITKTIVTVRNKKVILDSNLAALYGVETKRLNEQVRRNIHKFPDDFMFRLTQEEFDNLKSQIATSSWGGKRKPPLVFTEHGALQAANVLNSLQANKMSVYIVRAFIRQRKVVLANDKLASRLDQLEKRIKDHDKILIDLVQEILKLSDTNDQSKSKSIGFILPEKSP